MKPNLYQPIADNIITQATAARLKEVSRQRIHQLVKDGRLSVARLPSGEVVEGAVYQSEVESLVEGKRGRPRLSEEELASRLNHDFKEGESVIWKHTPRDGYGYSILLPATVTKLGNKRVCLEFLIPAAPDNVPKLETAWVKPEVLLRKLDESLDIPIGKSLSSENGKHAAN